MLFLVNFMLFVYVLLKFIAFMDLNSDEGDDGFDVRCFGEHIDEGDLFDAKSVF